MNLTKRIYWRIAELTWRNALKHVAYASSLPDGVQLNVRKKYWDSRASWIHYRWGLGIADYHIIERIITEYGIASVLDLGCGSGRLFPLYEQLSIGDVLGVDISMHALAIARERYPQAKTMCASLEDMVLPDEIFDLGISVRTLQNVPKDKIDAVMANICGHCTMLFVSEVTEAEGLPEKTSFYLHEYRRLFGGLDYQLVESGSIGDQDWTLWGAV